jgi:hypothetical protein
VERERRGGEREGDRQQVFRRAGEERGIGPLTQLKEEKESLLVDNRNRRQMSVKFNRTNQI